MSALSIKGVARIHGEKIAVDGIDLEVKAGQFLTLLGPSGCGKTTTLRMIAGLDQVDAGVITIGGKVVNDASKGIFVPPEKRQLGMVFQSYAIWPHMTVFDNVAYPLVIRGRNKNEIHERVNNALKLVEMGDLAGRPAPALSGGQQQRVAIARAIVFEPQVLLLDEPLSNLDARLRLQMGAEFRDLQQRLGITTVYVTHDQDEAMALSDQVVVMQTGRILQIGAPNQIYNAPNSAAVASFFGNPNLLPATVSSCTTNSDSTYSLIVEGDHWQGSCMARENFAPQEKVLVVARPECLEFVPRERAGQRNVWLGHVSHSSFHGASRRFEIDVAGLKLRLDANGTDPVASGPVAVSTSAQSLWAIRPG